MDSSLNSVLPDHQRLLDAFLSRRKPSTRTTYLQSLTAWARWLGAATPAQGVTWLLGAGVLEGNARVLAFLDSQAAAGLSSATLSLRVAALRSMVDLANALGQCTWSLQVRGPNVTPYRDSRGPGPVRIQAIIQAARGQASKAKATRDVAILRMMHDQGLRRGEVAGLRLEDLDLDGRRVWIMAKGSLDREPVTLPAGTAGAIQSWLSWRGEAPGPLFHRLDNAGANLVALRPLTGRAVWNLVHGLALGCGFMARPHGFRHSAITEALDAGFDLRAVARFGRWKSGLNIAARYDDNRRDMGGEIAGALARGMDDARIH